MPEFHLTAAQRKAQRQVQESTQPKSWAEALQRYDDNRQTHDQHILSPTRGAPRFTTGIRGSFDPLTQTFRDSSQEQNVQKQEQTNLLQHIQKGKERFDKFAKVSYNIVSGQQRELANPKLIEKDYKELTKYVRTQVWVDPKTGQRGYSHQPSPLLPEHAKREYNIINNSYAFSDSEDKLREKERRIPKKSDRNVIEKRDFNIINGRWKESHEEKQRQSEDLNRKHLEQKYWMNNHYDPIKMVFYNPEEEKRFQQARLDAQSTHGFATVANLPSKVKRSEGMLYNIVAPAIVHDPLTLEQRDERELNKMKKHDITYNYQRDVARKDALLDDKLSLRSINRINYDRRMKEQTDRNYHIISNETLNGTLPKQTSPFPALPASWEELQKVRLGMASAPSSLAQIHTLPTTNTNTSSTKTLQPSTQQTTSATSSLHGSIPNDSSNSTSTSSSDSNGRNGSSSSGSGSKVTFRDTLEPPKTSHARGPSSFGANEQTDSLLNRLKQSLS